MNVPSSKVLPTRILGVDYGMARIGVALSDEKKILASPICTLTCLHKLEETVMKLVEWINSHQKQNGYELAEIVVGLPLLMSGKQGLLADEVKQFCELLKSKVSTPIKIWDERLSSVQAERSLQERGFSRKKRAKVVDQVAAVIILQSYLNLFG